MVVVDVRGPHEGPLEDAEQRRIIDFVESQRSADGRPALSDELLLDLRDGAAGAVAAVAVVGDELVGYAQASPVHGGNLVGMVGDGRGELLRAIVERLPGQTVTWWEFDPDARSDEVAAAAGLHRGRELLQMRVALPLAQTTAIVTRDSRAGDEAAWVEVNNAAFAWHPEQAGWTVDDVHRRQGEPWWRADGLRILELEGRMAGFCWTKIHAEHRPPLGEIYVIAVHPDFHRRGLGRALTIDGLRWLSEHGVSTGMLYVDADNTAAVELYRSLGFHVHERQQAYTNHPTEPR